MLTISQLYIYPVKSLAGIQLDHAGLSRFGLKHDRRWMIVDDNGRFMSQREIAQMATIKTSFKDECLHLEYRDDICVVSPVTDQSRSIEVTVWKDTVIAKQVSDTVDQWLSNILGGSCHLVYMQQDAQRQIDQDYAKPDQYVSFADGFPILAISEASLDDLNQRLDKPININRFRPNIVVSGCTAFAEDDWSALSINDVDFLAVKQCSRCIMPSINQSTGEKDQPKLLSVMGTYRRQNNKIKFGQNLIYKDPNKARSKTIYCGAEVKLKHSSKKA